MGSRIKTWWNNFVPEGEIKGKLARNTLWMMLGYLGRFGLQIVYFLLLARALQPHEYGLYMGCFGLINVLFPFVAWGSGSILIKHVSRSPETFKEYWGMALSVTLLSGSIITIISFLLGCLIFQGETAWSVLLPMSIGLFIGEGLATIAGQGFQAVQKLSRMSLINFLIGFFRLCGVLILVFSSVEKNASVWAVLFMISTLISGLIGVMLVNRDLGRTRLSLALMKGKWGEGLNFAIGLSAQGAYNDIDKTMLVRLSSQAVSGVYSAAYRIMDAAFIPVRSLIFSSYPIFFQKGEQGVADSRDYARRLLPWAAGCGVLMGICLAVFSPLVPVFLGEEYSQTVQILLWLAPIPLFRAFSYLAANALTGSGFQGIRSGIQVFWVVINFVLNLIWIPIYGWMGAAWSSLITDGFLALSMWICLAVKVRGTKTSTSGFDE